MKIDERMRKSVAFVGYQMHDGSERLAGSGFFIGDPVNLGSSQTVGYFAYFATALHVVQRIQRLGVDGVLIRINLKSGGTGHFKIPFYWWFAHPSDPNADVAMAAIAFPSEADHMILSPDVVATPERLQQFRVGLGDAVSVIGLFKHHHGTLRNNPIVRTGNLAAFGEERVSTKLGEMDALLIEARSIGGLSGSPVFVNLGAVRNIDDEIYRIDGGEAGLMLLGMMHGHYDAEPGRDLVDADEGLTPARVNTGIGIVIPVGKILEVMRGPNKPQGTLDMTVQS